MKHQIMPKKKFGQKKNDWVNNQLTEEPKTKDPEIATKVLSITAAVAAAGEPFSLSSTSRGLLLLLLTDVVC